MQYGTLLRHPGASNLREIHDNPLPNDVAQVLIGSYRTISVWRKRAEQRRQLIQLPDDRLRDIGVTRQEAVREAKKPFWRP